MTAGEAIKMADELRPNNSFSDEMKQLWLRQADSGLRRNVVERSDTGSDFEGRGADILWAEGLEYDTPLLADNIAGHIAFGMGSGSVHSVMVNGVMVYEDRQFNFDCDSIYAQARKAAASMWRRMDALA